MNNLSLAMIVRFSICLLCVCEERSSYTYCDLGYRGVMLLSTSQSDRHQETDPHLPVSSDS